jgi:magnesium-dependent phosphatase 1
MRVPGSSQAVYLFDGARRALCVIATDAKYKNVIIAVVSSSLEPTYSHQCLNNIEIVQGVTMRDLFHYDEIGRNGNLTSSKTAHFQSLHLKSHVPYEEMLFFDDCNWGDHVQDFEDSFGVMGQRTPNGLQIEECYTGLEKHHKRVQGL